MDPLSLLREYVTAGRVNEIAQAGDRVDFGGRFTFSKNVATGYKSQQGKGAFYDLETLVYFVKNMDAKFREYLQKATKELGKGKAVSFIDRKDLIEYLEGKSDHSQFIQLAVPDFEVGQPAKRARLEAGAEAEEGAVGEAQAPAEEEAPEDAMLRMVRQQELQLRDRNSMLSVPGRSFRKVLTILGQVQREQMQQLGEQRSKQRKTPQKPVIPVRPSGRYERQTQQDATLKQLGAAQLGVQVAFKPATAAAAAAGSSGPKQLGAAPPPPPPPAAAPPPRPRQQQQQRPSASGRPSQQQAPSSGGRRPAASPQQKRPVRQGTPVIMVPPGMTALINIHNVRAFLEEGRFLTTEQAKAEKAKQEAEQQKKAEEAARAAGQEPPKPKPPAKEDRIAISRTIGRKAPVKYYVTDKEPSHPRDWGRVVAVVCLGKAWQFKKWPFKGADRGELVDTFSRVLGVHVHYSDEGVDATVRSWNVRLLGLNRESRHRDATVAQEFWRLLDAHLQARGSTLAY